MNDFHLQTLKIDHPEISVINLPYKVNTLGEKRNMAAALSKGEVLFPWDDDDICLPFRVSKSVDILARDNVEYYKPTTAFFWNNGKIDSIEVNNFHAQCCYTRELFNRTSYSVMGCGEDKDFDEKVKKILRKRIDSEVLPHENFYLYRWAGTESYHLSAIDDKNAENIVLTQQTTKAKLGNMLTGEIRLNPSWKIDYAKQAKDFIDQLAHSR